ncbi:MAG: glycosyltransferase 87 family protein [Candidatus Brocadiia bacterium]
MCASEAPQRGPSPSPHETTRVVRVPVPRQSRAELVLLFAVFLALRLMSAGWFFPRYTEAGSFFFPFAYLQRLGYYPFVDFWLEYPPLLAYLLVVLGGLARAVGGGGEIGWQRACFVHTVQVGSILWETVVLALVYSLARMVRGQRAAARAAWVYVALFATGFVALSYVDTFPVALMLCALALAVHSRAVWGSLVVGLGFMAKVFPIALLPVALKSDDRRRVRAACVLAFLAVVFVCVLPFLGSGWVRCWAASSLRRPPWQTVWALLDRRYEFGYVGPGPEHMTEDFFEPERFAVAEGTRELVAALPPELFGVHEAQVRTGRYRLASRFARELGFMDSSPRTGAIYWWVYGGAGLVLGLFYVATFAVLPAPLPPRRRVTFAAFSLLVLFLYSKGWSPQFVAYIIPLLLVVFPTAEGGLWALLLTATAFLETPVWTHFALPRYGPSSYASLVLALAVLGRTVLLVLIAARLYPRLFRD